MSEESFAAGQRILRQGISGSGFFVILDGEVSVRVDGADVARLGRGEFFGETSLLLGRSPRGGRRGGRPGDGAAAGRS